MLWVGHAVCCLFAQSCPTLCYPMDCNPPVLLCPWDQARILQWAAISFSSGFGHMPSKMRAFQEALVLKNLTASAGHMRDMGSSPGSGVFSGGGHGSPVHYSCLEMDGGAWWASVRGVTKSWARLSGFTFTFTMP